jgi:hypothetical protein
MNNHSGIEFDERLNGEIFIFDKDDIEWTLYKDDIYNPGWGFVSNIRQYEKNLKCLVINLHIFGSLELKPYVVNYWITSNGTKNCWLEYLHSSN